MPNVFKLVRRDHSSTVSAAKVVTHKAIAGEVDGLVMIYRDPEGVEKVVVTGAYANAPGLALRASLRLFRLLETQDQDSLQSP